jgi:hypothetical protein
MIPECIHHYGEEAAKLWFSNAGLLAYHQVQWDPTKKSTTSQEDHTTRALVEEDLFQLGSHWKLEAPILKAKAKRGHVQDNPYVVQNLLDSRNTDSDVRSFGSAYQRTHDADSIQTEHEDDMETDSTKQTVVQIDLSITITAKTTDDDISMDASSAEFTTGTTRSLLHKERQKTDNLRKELQELLTREDRSSDDESTKTTKSTTDKLAQAMTKIKLMEDAQTRLERQAPIISPYPNKQAPAIEERTGTEAVSAGRDG